MGPPCARVLIKIAHIKPKVRRTLLAKLRFDFMAPIIRANWIFASGELCNLSPSLKLFSCLLCGACRSQNGWRNLAAVAEDFWWV